MLTTRSGDRLALQLVYRNAGAEVCTMHGHPTVMAVEMPTKTLVTVPHATLGSLGTSVPVRTVTLAAGASASALVEWSPVSHLAGGSCLWGGYLTTTPPGSTVSTAVGRDGLGRVCDVHVLPVVANTSHAGYALAPRSRTLLGLVVSHARLSHAYRVVLAPAVRQRDGQFVAVPGRATVSYDIPAAIVPAGLTLEGPITVTARGSRVTSFSIVGG